MSLCQDLDNAARAVRKRQEGRRLELLGREGGSVADGGEETCCPVREEATEEKGEGVGRSSVRLGGAPPAVANPGA